MNDMNFAKCKVKPLASLLHLHSLDLPFAFLLFTAIIISNYAIFNNLHCHSCVGTIGFLFHKLLLALVE